MNFKFLSYISILLFSYFINTAVASDSYELQIEEAKWESGDSLLVVKGKAPKRTSVVIKNADDLSIIKQVISNREGKWLIKVGMSKPPCEVQAVSSGNFVSKTVENASRYCDSTKPPDGDGSTPSGDYVSLAINDLGMHCADLDYKIFSILPPYNVVHGQVIKKGSKPKIMDSSQVDMFYKAAPSPDGNITTTSQNIDGNWKSNFWGYTNGKQLGRIAYGPLYPPNVLPELGPDQGLLAPDVAKLYLDPNPELKAHQQAMPGIEGGNDPQEFLGYIGDFPFFSEFPFGYVASDLKRFTAEGIPILPAADAVPHPDCKDSNPDNCSKVIYEAPYPLMEVSAVSKDGKELSSVRTVLPVASEADCQLCHLDADICLESPVTSGKACDNKAETEFNEITLDDYKIVDPNEDNFIPGSTRYQKVMNAAKINILRLHDVKHGTSLDEKRSIVCATCHYSPALDLAHLGPQDDPQRGVEQRQHVSMSRAMHQHHGDTGLFEDMPEPGNRDPEEVQRILGETCYACHPGKRTKCLRGAMTKAGIVCQDCHGNMQQVGDDFSINLPNAQVGEDGKVSDNELLARLDTKRRVPWAHEPGCQSCHTGDAVDNMADEPGVIKAPDSIRLLQAFKKKNENGISDAKPIVATNRRFAESRDAQGNDHLYRLSKGHGGVMCEGCHGSTHAVWPNPIFGSNDNLTAKDLQGHAGTLTECSVCHGNASLGLTLKGPHGMHPVGSKYWNEKHEEVSERNADQCKTCHGKNGEGTVLSRTAIQREWICKDKKGSLCSYEDQVITVPTGTKVSCTQCHENKINGDDD